MTGEIPSELAEQYIEALESRAGRDEYDSAREHLEALKSRLQEFEESYGDSDPATEELAEKVRSAEQEVSRLEQQGRKPEEVKGDLLEAARGFMLNGEWLEPQVIEALNHALVGACHLSLRVGDIEVARPKDAEELDDVDRFDIIDVVRTLALDKLGEQKDLEEVWRSIEGTAKEEAFEVVAENGAADPDDVLESLEGDLDRSAARNRLKNAVYDSQISPYYRENGTYALSTAGLYMAAEYAGVRQSGDRGQEGGGLDKNGQTVLGERLAATNGGEDDE